MQGGWLRSAGEMAIRGSTPAVWQLTTGLPSGSYADVLVGHGVALVGPGDSGPWLAGRDGSLLRHVRRFASEVREGDVLLLREGSSALKAIGLVAGPYQYLSQFDDVNGWDLQHGRRARWLALPDAYDFGSPVFGSARFGKVEHSEVLPLARQLLNSPPSDWQLRDLPELPAEEPELDDVPPSLAEVVALTQDLGGNLYWDEARFGGLPKEHEIVAHLVVPFLRALGWLPEQVAVEWRRTDAALFAVLPRTPANCRLIVEAKTLGDGLDLALEQAKGYVDATGAACDVLVTNGIRYRLHARDREYTCVAYANLAKPKRSAKDLFARLLRP